MRDRHVIQIALAVQALCAGFFITDILSAYVGFRATPISWRARELIEIGAALGLLLGFVLGAVALRRSRQRQRLAEDGLRRASAAFMDVVETSFAEWGLTPAECDVALFAIKGLSIHEIAAVRQTSDGTVKAQTNAIYRKAGVSGRSQLLSLFLDVLIDDSVFPASEPEVSGQAPLRKAS